MQPPKPLPETQSDDESSQTKTGDTIPVQETPPDPLSEAPFLVRTLFPSSEIHIVAGPSGSGKSTLLFQWLADWQRGEPVLGHESNPCPYVVVTCDRKKSSAEATLNRIGLLGQIGPIYGVSEFETRDHLIDDFAQIVDHAKFPGGKKLVILEGLASLVPGGKINDYSAVSQMLKRMSRTCEARGMAVIGTMHNAKTADNHRISHPRERLLGSVAWSGFADTIVVVEPTSMSNPLVTKRQVYVMPRNAKGESLQYELDSVGRFVPVAGSQTAVTFSDELKRVEKIFEWVNQQKGVWQLSELVTFSKNIHDISKSSVLRAIDAGLQNRQIRKVNRGLYEQIKPN